MKRRRPYTHAFFPQDHFDEVIQEGNGTFGRKGDGYVALYSWREPTWRVYDPDVHATRDMVEPFDLVAEGGPDNVWIVEVGDAGQAAFGEWVDERVSAAVTVERDDGFTVDWTSPASGALGFGSTGAFTVDSEEQQLADFPRHDTPWGTVDRLEKLHELAAGDSSITLDFAAMTRRHARAGRKRRIGTPDTRYRSGRFRYERPRHTPTDMPKHGFLPARRGPSVRETPPPVSHARGSRVSQ